MAQLLELDGPQLSADSLQLSSEVAPSSRATPVSVIHTVWPCAQLALRVVAKCLMSAVAPGTPLVEAVIDQAESELFSAMVPSSEPKFLVVNATTYSALRQIERFSEFQTAGEAGLRALIDGTVGKIKDFFVMRSQFVAMTGSSPITTHNLAFTKPAIGLVIRRLPQPLYGTGAVAHYAEMGNFGMRVVMSYQPNTLAQQFTVDVLYGCAVIRNNFGVQVNS